jgi:hypothetical protein
VADVFLARLHDAPTAPEQLQTTFGTTAIPRAESEQGEMAMKVGEVEELLANLRPVDPRITCEMGRRDDTAFLRLEVHAPDRWAVVWTPGDRWFALDTDKRLSDNIFDEGISDDDANKILTLHVAAATAYVRGSYQTRISRIFRFPIFVIPVGDEEVVLRQSLRASVLHVLGKRSPV